MVIHKYCQWKADDNVTRHSELIQNYLDNHPVSTMAYDHNGKGNFSPENMVFQLVYAFTNTTRWVDYERIQSDIFDHILAVVPEFDLKIFKTPQVMISTRFKCIRQFCIALRYTSAGI